MAKHSKKCNLGYPTIPKNLKKIHGSKVWENPSSYAQSAGTPHLHYKIWQFIFLKFLLQHLLGA